MTLGDPTPPAESAAEEIRRLRRRVAELETAAAERQRSGAGFRRLYESNIVGVMFADTRGNITEANDAFLDLVGYRRGDLPLRWDEMTPIEWRHLDEAKTAELAATGVGKAWEKEYFRCDGSRVPILVGIAQLEERTDEVVCFALDLSDRKRAEELLRESEQRYRTFYEHIPLMYFTLDAAGSILSVNASGAEELGYRPEELAGRSVLKVFHPDDHRPVETQLRDAVASPGKVATWEFRKVRKDGGILWVREAARAVRRADGSTVVLVVCEDVSERKEAERQLIEHKGKLRTLSSELALAEERERRRIGGGLHDHVGHPLAAAKMRLGALLAQQPEAEIASSLKVVEELLAGAIDETRTLSFELSSPVLYELGLEQALRSLGSDILEANGIDFEIAGSIASAPLTEDVRVTLYRVVQELLFNIVKHAGARQAGLAMHRVKGEVRITVEDDGVGIGSDESGQRLSATGGLGLFGVRERLHHLGGRLEIESDPELGTRMVVAVPEGPGRPAENR